MGNFLDTIKDEALILLHNKKNLISLLVLAILILALPLGVDLIQKQKIFKSRATADPIVFTGDNIRQKADGSWVALRPQISLELTSPLGSPAPFVSSTTSSSPVSNPTGSVQAGFSRVFVTSATYNGNLGGLAGADSKCQERANVASLGGTWKAWLSSDNVSAASRLSHSNNPYKLINGAVVANNWNSLVDISTIEPINSPINITENSSLAAVGNVWTGSGPDGLSNSRLNCQNWTDSTTGMTGAAGNSNEAGRVEWTYADGAVGCSSQARLYCFEQN